MVLRKLFIFKAEACNTCHDQTRVRHDASLDLLTQGATMNVHSRFFVKGPNIKYCFQAVILILLGLVYSHNTFVRIPDNLVFPK